MPLPILRNPKLELAHPCYQGSRVVTRPISLTSWIPFSLFCSKGLAHLSFQDLLEHLAQNLLQTVPVLTENLLEFDRYTFRLLLGHGISFRLFGVGGCASKHPYAMTSSLVHPFLQNLSE